MECSGKREIRGEVGKEWLSSVETWKSVEMKDVSVVKREVRVDEMKIHMSKPTSFSMNGQTIRCSEGWNSWFIDRELQSVCIYDFIISSFIYSCIRGCIDCLFFSYVEILLLFMMDKWLRCNDEQELQSI